MTEFGPPEAGVKACEMCACYCIIPTPIQEVQGWENPRKGQLAQHAAQHKHDPDSNQGEGGSGSQDCP